MRDLWCGEPEYPSKEALVLFSKKKKTKKKMTLEHIKMLRFPLYRQSHVGAMKTEAKL